MPLGLPLHDDFSDEVKNKHALEENEVCSFICGGFHAMQDEQMLSKTANLRGDFGSHSGLPPVKENG